MNIDKIKILSLKFKGVAIFLLVAGFITVFMDGIFDIKASINDKILFITFLALIWYAWETQGMKREMIIQNELEQRPIIDLFFRPKTDKHKSYFRLRNSGKGIAYIIKVKDVIIDNKKFKFYFDDPNSILTTNEEKTLEIIGSYKNEDGNECIPGDPVSFFLDSIGEKTFEYLDKNGFRDLLRQPEIKLIITYENALKVKFERTFIVTCTGVMIDLDSAIKNQFEFIFKEERVL